MGWLIGLGCRISRHTGIDRVGQAGFDREIHVVLVRDALYPVWLALSLSFSP